MYYFQKIEKKGEKKKSKWLFGAHFIQKSPQKVFFWLKNGYSISKIAVKKDLWVWQSAQSIQDA